MLEMPASMISESAGRAWEPLTRREKVPCDRFKHVTAVHNGFVYVHGGRQDSDLGDFWRYNIAAKQWDQLAGGRQAPDKLEGHSMVAYQDVLYVFGGMVDCAANREKTPLWMYSIEPRKWCEYKSPAGQESRPINRKGHSAAVYQSAMYLYGGYIDMKGVLEEFWVFYFDAQRWSALSPRTRGLGPGPRHGHSSVTHNAAMYLFGGLKNMDEQNDFWRFDFRRHNWSCIKTSSGPPKLVGHASLVHRECLWIIGGGLASRNPTSNLWKYNFTSKSWKKVSQGKERNDCARMYHCVAPLGRPSRRTSSELNGESDDGYRLYPPHSWGANRVAAVSTSELIEMQTLTEPPASPIFCSCSSTDPAEELQLSSYENECFTLSGEEEETGEQQTDSRRRTEAENEDIFLVMGGKPLSRHGGISIAYIRLE
ncbi:leucine-zipper-like transcriptional regulator 1 homolog [Hyperolius riggenbachi]|uniref:leucine-zipper-like transcriptional regulator 1 homolog n=1 Tax=Hyperolius riggenbachi TaxID=752182 RepID=UPI0035A2D23C